MRKGLEERVPGNPDEKGRAHKKNNRFVHIDQFGDGLNLFVLVLFGLRAFIRWESGDYAPVLSLALNKKRAAKPRPFSFKTGFLDAENRFRRSSLPRISSSPGC
jgi:hypothetical protein